MIVAVHLMRVMRAAEAGASIVIDHVARAPLAIFAIPPPRFLAERQRQ
jgi:hypothetical protein